MQPYNDMKKVMTMTLNKDFEGLDKFTKEYMNRWDMDYIFFEFLILSYLSLDREDRIRGLVSNYVDTDDLDLIISKCYNNIGETDKSVSLLVKIYDKKKEEKILLLILLNYLMLKDIEKATFYINLHKEQYKDSKVLEDLLIKTGTNIDDFNSVVERILNEFV